MRLLFDQNLSPKLVNHLADLFPESNHVHLLGMDFEEDINIWKYALDNGFVIVTRDSDYNELITLKGFPPKVIWIKRGNCSTKQIESILRAHIDDILLLENEQSFGILTLY